jgi:hypothetical protein
MGTFSCPLAQNVISDNIKYGRFEEASCVVYTGGYMCCGNNNTCRSVFYEHGVWNWFVGGVQLSSFGGSGSRGSGSRGSGSRGSGSRGSGSRGALPKFGWPSCCRHISIFNYIR